jgi:hypothetical protein
LLVDEPESPELEEPESPELEEPESPELEEPLESPEDADFSEEEASVPEEEGDVLDVVEDSDPPVLESSDFSP